MTFDITQEQTARKENFKQRLCLKIGDKVKIPASEKQGFLIAIVEKIYKHCKTYKWKGCKMNIKFRQNGTGQILDYSDYRVCGQYDGSCKDCPAYQHFPHKNDVKTECDEFIINNPRKFAELMGLELLVYQRETANIDVIDRKKILEKSIKCVCGDRDKQYGNPEDNFKNIADLWNIYLENKDKLNAQDVACMMCLFKIARIKTGTDTLDSFVDLAGYAACGGEIACKNIQKEN